MFRAGAIGAGGQRDALPELLLDALPGLLTPYVKAARGGEGGEVVVEFVHLVGVASVMAGIARQEQ